MRSAAIRAERYSTAEAISWHGPTVAVTVALLASVTFGGWSITGPRLEPTGLSASAVRPVGVPTIAMMPMTTSGGAVTTTCLTPVPTPQPACPL